MRCPKCQYISFDSGERCRNCGYDFSLSATDEATPAPVDVTIGRDDPPSGRAADNALHALDAPLTTTATPEPPPGRVGRPMSVSDLPLFIEGVADDQAPLVAPPAHPRPPLAVRRATPSRGRERAPDSDSLPLDLGALPAESPDNDTVPATTEAAALHAGIARRIVAGIIDLCVLGPILAAVVYLTLRLCGLTLEEWRLIPLFPLGAFLLLLCGGYFVLFTAAGGQTIGKMAAKIRVVSAADGHGPLRVSFSTAMIRSLVCLGSVLALGAGFLPILFSSDRRALHDRVAETRVVPA